VLAGPRPGRAQPERDLVWLQLRRELSAAAAIRGQCDPRQLLEMCAEDQAAWRAVYRTWAAAFFAGDTRVDTKGSD
jgi:hypothetical protein